MLPKKPLQETKFRFPFPNEDSLSYGEYAEYNKAFEVPAGDVEVNHTEIVMHNTHQTGGYGINIFLPCPYSKEFKEKGFKVSAGGAGEQFLDVVMQAYRNGNGTIENKVRTIFKCSRCEQMQWFTEDVIKKIRVRATEYYPVYEKSNEGLYEYSMKVIERMS